MFTLPIPVLLIITVIASWGKSVLGGYYVKSVPDSERYRWQFGWIQSLACAIGIAAVLLLSGGLGTVSVTTVLLGVALGLANIFGLMTNLAAMACGPFSYTTVIISLSAVIPALSGPLFGDPMPTAVQYVGMMFMVICLFLAPDRTKEESKSVSLKWMVWCAASAVCSGVTGIVQKAHQNSAYASEMAALLLVAFSISAVFSLIMTLGERGHREYGGERVRLPKAVWGTAAISGAIFAFPHTINLFLAGALPAVIMFPMVNLCPMILSMTTGIFLFRERLNALRWIGVVVGIAAIVLVSGVVG